MIPWCIPLQVFQQGGRRLKAYWKDWLSKCLGIPQQELENIAGVIFV